MKSELLTGLPIVLLFLLLSGSELVAGQPETRNDPYSTHDASRSVALAVFVIVLVFVLIFTGFLIVFIRHGSGEVNANAAGGARTMSNSTVARGIDALTIETFPTFVYSEVKTQRIGNGALECAICLNKFEDNETLRLLPKCDHVFHPHCIGAWLQGHVTCPVCRTNLADEEEKHESVQPERVITETDLESQQSTVPEPATELRGVKFSRSHTTGHSITVTEENTDRFTLRLPEELRKKIVSNWKMNRSNSFLVVPRNGKSAEPSRVRSDRWLFRKTPSFLWRNRDDGSIKANAVTSSTGDSV